MNLGQRVRQHWRMATLVFGVWTLVALFDASRGYLAATWASKAINLPGMAIDLGEVIAIALIECWVLAGLTFYIFWLLRRFPLEPPRLARGLLVHLLAALLIAVAHTALALLINWLLRSTLPKLDNRVIVQAYLVIKLPSLFFLYWLILAFGLVLENARRYHDRQLRTARLLAQLTQAQLQVLKMQLHPHFLFNTLNAISALMHQDVELADRMVARLGDLLRATLANAHTQEVPLKQELEFVRNYLEIEQARLGPRLAVELDIDPDALSAHVPNLILQPLVENAIRHGIAPRADPGRIEIRARRAPRELRLQICDDGPGLPADDLSLSELPQGVGVANTRERLRQLYGPAHRFEMTNGPGRGLVVTVTLPLRETPERDDALAGADRG